MNGIIETVVEVLYRHMNPVIGIQLDDDAYMPRRAHATDAGADIRTPVAVTVPPHGAAQVHTGVHVELPPNTVGMVKSKSGLNVKHDLTSEGVIDEGFSGEVIVKLYNHGPMEYRFERGDKITQLVVLPCHYPAYQQVTRVAGGERGDRGYGSTGR